MNQWLLIAAIFLAQFVELGLLILFVKHGGPPPRRAMPEPPTRALPRSKRRTR